VTAIWLRIGACRHRAALTAMIVLGVLPVTLTAAFGGNMFALFPLLSITCGVVPWTDRQPPLPSGGHGLRGLAERATAVGGTLQAGPCAGGYRLAVRVPAAMRQEVTA